MTTENKVFKQFEHLAELAIEEGAPMLREYFTEGDWTLLVINRGYLDELQLTDQEQIALETLDMGLAAIFTDALLDEYAVMDDDVRVWWG